MFIITLPHITLEEMPVVAQALLPVLRQGDVVSLNGDLGTGKSTFSRSIITSACGVDTVVPSPTFTLVQVYENSSIGCDIWHMDWYRLDDAEQIWELGVEEAFSTSVCLIEWAERASVYLPENTLSITIEDCGTSRTLSFSGAGDWQRRLQDIFNGL